MVVNDKNVHVYFKNKIWTCIEKGTTTDKEVFSMLVFCEKESPLINMSNRDVIFLSLFI